MPPAARPRTFIRAASEFLLPGGAEDCDNDSRLGSLLAVGVASSLTTVITTASLFLAWVQRMRPPSLHYSPTAANEAMLRDMPLLLRTYVPNMLSWNAHLAGFFGYVKLPGPRPPAARRETITLPDGGTVTLNWWSSEPINGRRVIVLFPGINNDAAMPYVRHLSSMLHREGLGDVAAVDWRGLGGQTLTSVTDTPRPYSAAASPDVASILAHLRARLPDSPLFAIGWSMGGGMLLRHMGDFGDECLLHGAVAVSPLIDIKAGYKHPASAAYGAYLPIITAPLVHYLWTHRRALTQGPTPVHFFRDVLFGALREWEGLDDKIYGPLWGLKGKDEYAERGSPKAVLGAIRRATLIVHSEDDPICPVTAMPLAEMAANPSLVTAITRHGGHMGYTAGLSPLAHTWTDRLLVHFLRHFDRRGGRQPATSSEGRHVEAASPPPADLPVFAVQSKL